MSSICAAIETISLSGGDIGKLVIVCLLLVCSALISSSEAAFFSLSPQNINTLRNSTTRSAQTALQLLSIPDNLLATILIANNFVNICIVLFLNSVITTGMEFGGPVAEFIFKVVVVTFILLLFGEIMPKIYASYNSLRVVRFMAVPLKALKSLLHPFALLLVRAGNTLGSSRRKANISIDELSDAIEITSDQSAEEKKMLSGILHFVNTEVDAIMKPRVDMVALEITSDIDMVRKTIVDSGFSRIPVYEDSIDNIKGILYVKDMLPHMFDKQEYDWTLLLRKPYFIPEHKKINDLLEEFRDDKVHLAIVVDEYGSTLGLVSLEDILEEIVGEISDESDIDHAFYKKLSTDTYLFEGKTHLSDVVKVLGLDDHIFNGVRGNAETLAGLMLEIKRDFLHKGESITHSNLVITAEEIEGRRIDQVKVVIKKVAGGGTNS